MIFIVWVHMAIYYTAPVIITLIGFKEIFDSYIIKVISDEKCFWVRTPFPLGALFIFG